MPKIKVLDTFAIPVEKYEILNKLGTVSMFTDIPENDDATLKRAEGGEVLVLNKTKITANVIDRLAGVALIAETASGYDNIDIKAADAKGITVCNAPGYSTASVAEHVFAMLLHMNRKLTLCQDQTAEGKWLEEPLIGEEIAGKTIGIIGFGAIGRSTARIARGFNMKVIVHTRSPEKYKDNNPDIEFKSVDEIVQESDVVSLHLPANEETEHIINKDRLAAMKPGAVLVNCARGKVVDQDALTEICEQGTIFACLDVLNTESIEKGNRLAACPNVFVAPHVGWYTDQALDRLIQITYDNIENFFAGNPKNVI